MRKIGILLVLFLLSALSIFIGVKDLVLQALFQGDSRNDVPL